MSDQSLAYAVTRLNQTEAPFTGEYWDFHEPGLYVDVNDGQPLFLSSAKFDSGCGWPSFFAPVKDSVRYLSDKSHGMDRIEVRSTGADSHLGHVFPDGPKAHGGLRYCINSAALRFIPYSELEKEGFGEYKDQLDAMNAQKTTE